MSAADVLARVRAAGADLRLDGERLVLRAGPAGLPADLIAMLRDSKPDLLALLQGSDAEEVAGTLAAGLGESREDFEAVCRKVLGRPAPRTRDEDDRVKAAILAGLTHRVTAAGPGLPTAPHRSRDAFLLQRLRVLLLDAEHVLGPGEPGLAGVFRETVGPESDLGDLADTDIGNAESWLRAIEIDEGAAGGNGTKWMLT